MKPIYLSIVALLSTGAAFSATTLYDFEGPTYTLSNATDNRDPLPSGSWTQTSANPVSGGTAYSLSYVEGWTNVTGGGGTKAGAIGTPWANSSDATTSVYGVLPSTSILNQKITTTLAITDTSVGFGTRDSFGMTIRATGGATLAQLTFTPETTDATQAGGWLVSYTTSTGTVQIPTAIGAGFEYNFSLTFLASGVELSYADAGNNSSNTVYFLPTGYTTATNFQDIGFSITQSGASNTWGDSTNFLRFDNITSDVVPEASTFALAGVAALGFLRRRRA